MYEEAYNDYLKDRAKGNATLVTFHAAVSNHVVLISTPSAGDRDRAMGQTTPSGAQRQPRGPALVAAPLALYTDLQEREAQRTEFTGVSQAMGPWETKQHKREPRGSPKRGGVV